MVAFSQSDSHSVSSPDETLRLSVALVDGQPHYSVVAVGDTVVAPSPLGFQFEAAPPCGRTLR